MHLTIVGRQFFGIMQVPQFSFWKNIKRTNFGHLPPSSILMYSALVKICEYLTNFFHTGKVLQRRDGGILYVYMYLRNYIPVAEWYFFIIYLKHCYQQTPSAFRCGEDSRYGTHWYQNHQRDLTPIKLCFSVCVWSKCAWMVERWNKNKTQ